MSRDRLVVIGQALKPFGIRGQVKIRPFTESFEPFVRSAELVFDDTSYRVLDIRFHKGTALAALEGIDSPEKARELCGSLVRTDKANLPPVEEDEYYWNEILGMEVATVDGKALGRVTHIIRTGANDVLQVEGAYGEVLLPMIDEVIVEVDLQERKIVADPLDGLIPDG